MSRWTAADARRLGAAEYQNGLSAAPERARIDSTKAQATSMSPSEPAGKRQRSKYGAVKTNGYASKREAIRAASLKLLVRCGDIRNLQEQVKYELIPKQDGERAVAYVADFVYERIVCNEFGTGPAVPEQWERVVEDTKGHRTADYIIKRKLMLFIHGIAVRET